MAEKQDAQEFWDDYQHLKKEVSMMRDTEKRLKGVQNRYKALFAAGGELYAVLDKNGTFLDMNPAGLALLELDTRDIIGKTADEIFGESRAKVIGEKAKESIEQEKPLRFDWIVRRIGGPNRIFSARLAPIFDDAEQVTNAYLIAMDISSLEAAREDMVSMGEAIELMKDRIDRMLDAAKADPIA